MNRSARLRGLLWAGAIVLSPPALAQTLVGTITRPNLEPTAMVLDESRNRLLVADYTSKNIFVYDATTLAEITSLPGSLEVITDLVIDEPSGKLFASCFCINRSGVAVIDTVGGTPSHIITTDTITHLAQNKVLRKIYALHRFGFMEIDAVTEVTRSITAIGSNSLREIAVNPITHEIFISTYQFDQLDVVDGVTFTPTTVAGLRGLGVTVNPLRNKVYLAYEWKIYDRSQGTIKTLSNGNDATRLFYNPASNRIYSTAEVNNFTTIIDGDTDEFFNFPMASAGALAFRESTNHVYFTPGSAVGVLDDVTQALTLIPMPPGTNPSPSFDWNAQEILIQQSTGRVYVINNSNNNNIAVIQDSDRITRPLIYVGSKGSFRFHLLDSVTRTAMMTHGENPRHGFSFRPDGGRLYSASLTYLYAFAGTGNFPIVMQIPINGDETVVTVVSPDETRAYVTDERRNHVSVVDLASSSVSTISVGSGAWGAAITPDGSNLYVSNRTDNTVSAVSTALNVVTKTISVGARPWGVAINPSGTKLYVANSNASSVTVLDTMTDQVLRTVAVGQTPHWITLAPHGKHAYVSNYGDGTVSEIEAGSNNVVRTFVVGSSPEGLAVTPDGATLHVVNSNLSGASSLTSVNLATGEVSTVTLPEDSRESIGIAMADTGSKFAGRVTTGGCGIEGAVVRALQGAVEMGRATTNAAGDYAIIGLPAGTYDLELSGSQIAMETRTGLSVASGRTTLEHFSPAGPSGCRRGDVNGDGVMSPADVFYLIQYLFAAGPAPRGSGDTNSDGAVDVADIFYLINHLFVGGPAPL